ncbi:MAG TPA: transcriptional repressor [Tissierellia bacterium]|jgi:Fe2+ or Zn2+ uptake regulation protein|nr:transcriptional repressor [Tissierellia bacterium]
MLQKKLIERLKSHDISVSMQRLHILEFLLEKPEHYRAEEVYEMLKPKIPTLSLSTVYNTLHLFSERGLLKTLHLEEGVTHYDGVLEEHAHFVCEKCLKIFNVPLKETLPEADLPGMKILQVNLTYRGICHECLI